MGKLYNRPAFKYRRKDLRRTQTPAEDCFWNIVRNKKLNGVKLFRQYGIGPYILDFYAPKHRVCVEIDGEYHDDLDQRQYDEERTVFLHAMRISVARYSNNEVINHQESVLFRLGLLLSIPPVY
jgi:very-short-patch-repair endonuclease